MTDLVLHSPLHQFSGSGSKRPWDLHPEFDVDTWGKICEPCDEWFQNSYGFYRWYLIREAYYSGIIGFDQVVDLYRHWRDCTEYLMLNALDIAGERITSVFVKACKRGNDLYKKQMSKRFGFLDGLPPIMFFNDWGRKFTPMLFVTLTVDPKRFAFNDAWREISPELNIFETKLRQKYGKFVKLRVWEAHESGYPHSHIVYYFLDHRFEVFDYINKDGEQTYRIADKHRRAIGKMWGMGGNVKINYGVDVQAVQDTLGAFKEVKKYITKTIWGSKADRTNASLCLFRKQGYRISSCDPFNQKLPDNVPLDLYDRDAFVKQYFNDHVDQWCQKDFVGAIWGKEVYVDLYRELNETLAEPGLNALVKQIMCNYNIEVPEIVKWEFVGFVLGCDLAGFVKKFDDDDVVMLKDPPPDLYALVDLAGVY